MTKRQVGLIGLGPMGAGLATNLSGKGIEVVAWDRDIEPSNLGSWADGNNFRGCGSLHEVVSVLEAPRCILLSIPNGAPVDQVLEQLTPHLSPGDVVADCGNSYFEDSVRREQWLKEAGIEFLAVGVSGGPDGARHGPSIMVGGSPAGWDAIRPVFEEIAATADGDPCCGYLGGAGAGHFVKMVHNGIEYAIMHLLMEACAVLERACGFSTDQIADAFTSMNSGLNKGYLTEITASVVSVRAPGEDQLLIDIIDNAAEQKGTGRWAVQTALDLGVPVPTISEAVMYRQMSAATFPENSQQTAADKRCLAPVSNPTELDALLPDALTAAFISTFSQGLELCANASERIGDDLDIAEILRVWRRGCILQGELVNHLWAAFPNEKGDGSSGRDVLHWKEVTPLLEKGTDSLRRVVAGAALAGIPCTGFASALGYIESKLGEPLPTALLQLQRDCFGRHGLRDKRTGERIVVQWHQGSEGP